MWVWGPRIRGDTTGWIMGRPLWVCPPFPLQLMGLIENREGRRGRRFLDIFIRRDGFLRQRKRGTTLNRLTLASSRNDSVQREPLGGFGSTLPGGFPSRWNSMEMAKGEGIRRDVLVLVGGDRDSSANMIEGDNGRRSECMQGSKYTG